MNTQSKTCILSLIEAATHCGADPDDLFANLPLSAETASSENPLPKPEDWDELAERCLAAIKDFSARHNQLQQKHKAAQAQLLDLVDVIENTPAGILVLHQDQILYANQLARTSLGLENIDSLVGHQLSEQLAPGDMSAWETLQITSAPIQRVREFRLRKPDGQTVFMEFTRIGGVIYGGKDAYILLTHDLTRQRDLEHQLVQCTAREQERFARDLHDGLGQLLAAASFKCEAIRIDMTEISPHHADECEFIYNLIVEASEKAHAIARGLDPVELDCSGLFPALEDLAVRTADAFNIACTCSFAPGAPSPADKATATHIYRIAQEAIFNAVRHGKAEAIQVICEQDSICVRSQGPKLEQDPQASPGLGLRNMRHRARMIGATLDIDFSSPGTSTVKCILNRNVPDTMTQFSHSTDSHT